MNCDPNGKEYDKQSFEQCMTLLASVRTAHLPSEVVAPRNAFGRITSEAVLSCVDIPAYPSSIVDGFAVCASPVPSGPSLIYAQSIAGVHPAVRTPDSGGAVYVTTGGRVPETANCVIRVEDSTVHGSTVTFKPDTSATSGSNIRAVGSDTSRGSVILPANTLIGPAEVGLLFACKITEVSVFRRLRVHILSTGAEIASGEVGDANSAYLLSRLSLSSDMANCVEVTDEGALPDDEKAFTDIVASPDYDVLVTSGSVSKGSTDYMRKVVESLDFTVIFGQVDLKPGKPTMAAVGKRQQLVFCLPGNPASCFVTFNLFVLPMLIRLCGRVDYALRPTIARLVGIESIKPDSERPEFLRGVAELTREGSVQVKLAQGHQRSYRAASCSGGINCVVRIPPGVDTVDGNADFDCYILPGTSLSVSTTARTDASSVSRAAKASAFDALVEWLKVRNDVENIDLMNLAGFCRNCLSKWLSAGGVAIDKAKQYVYGMDYEEWKRLYRRGEMRAHNPPIPHKAVPVAKSNPCASATIVKQTRDVSAYILTVSDRASAGVYADESGPCIERMLTDSNIVAGVKGKRIVPDEISVIQAVVRQWVAGLSNVPSLIVITGGTGFSRRDVTPEAIASLIEKRANGLEHLLLSHFAASDPMYCLTRPVIGTIGTTLIITLPGRPGAVADGLQVLLPVIPKILVDLSRV